MQRKFRGEEPIIFVGIGSHSSGPVLEKTHILIPKPDCVRNQLLLPCHVTQVADTRPGFCACRHCTNLHAVTCVHAPACSHLHALTHVYSPALHSPACTHLCAYTCMLSPALHSPVCSHLHASSPPNEDALLAS